MSSDRRQVIFEIDTALMSIWPILTSESVSVYCRDVVSLLSVWVWDCWSAVGYDSSFVLMISFGVMSVIYKSQIGRFHTESYPKWPRHESDWFYGVFSNITGGQQPPDSIKILWFFCRFGRCESGITNEKSTLVQVMAWCRQATIHYLSQCWPSSMSPYSIAGHIEWNTL